jgi:hypothetical protein
VTSEEMTMKRIAAYSLLIFVSLFTSCSNDPDTVEEGSVRLIINVNHHGSPIANARLHRMNGTLTWPGTDTTQYDIHYQCDVNGNFTIENIGNGTKDLVIYATGIDPTWDSTGTTFVHGYQMFHIVTSIGEDKDVTYSLGVSE